MKALAFVLALAMSLPARALDCSQQPDPVPGTVVTESQVECIRRAIVNLRYERDTAHVEAVKQAQLVAACEATAAITCPPAPLPVVPVVVAYVAGALTVVAVGVVVLLGVGR